MLDFTNPLAFLLILFIPVVYVFRKAQILSGPAFPLTISDWNGKTFSWNSKSRLFYSVLVRIFLCSAYICVVIAFSDPVIHHQEKVYTSRGADILFLLDTSPSMAAKDIGGVTRLDSAKMSVVNLVNNNDGASYGLVAMGSEAAVVVPATMDKDIFLERLNSLVIGKMGDGTAIGTGLSLAVYHLSSSKALEKCIILITDGENNAGEIHPETAASLAKENGIKVYTLGVGTRGSVPLDYTDPVTGKQYSGYLDSNFDSSMLEKISSLALGRYYGIETLASLSNALSLIIKNHSVVQSYYLRNIDNKLYANFIFIAAALIVLSWIIRRIYLKEFL